MRLREERRSPTKSHKSTLKRTAIGPSGVLRLHMKSSAGFRQRVSFRQTGIVPHHLLATPPTLYFLEHP